MGFVRSLLFHIIFYPGSVVLCSFLLLASLISIEFTRIGSKLWATWFVVCARLFLGIRIQVRGSIPQNQVLVASKHTSAYETILTLYLFDFPAVVMKAELRKIPLWGFIANRHGSVFVERSKAGSALKSMLRQARARSAEGRPVFIFPEGTRVPVGEQPELKAGMSALYAGLKLPVVPVAHNAGEFWTRDFVKKPGTVTFAFLPDIPPSLPRDEIEERVRTAINLDPLTAEVRV